MLVMFGAGGSIIGPGGFGSRDTGRSSVLRGVTGSGGTGARAGTSFIGALPLTKPECSDSCLVGAPPLGDARLAWGLPPTAGGDAGGTSAGLSGSWNALSCGRPSGGGACGRTGSDLAEGVGKAAFGLY